MLDSSPLFTSFGNNELAFFHLLNVNNFFVSFWTSEFNHIWPVAIHCNFCPYWSSYCPISGWWDLYCPFSWLCPNLFVVPIIGNFHPGDTSLFLEGSSPNPTPSPWCILLLLSSLCSDDTFSVRPFLTNLLKIVKSLPIPILLPFPSPSCLSVSNILCGWLIFIV